jgi:hypothetical protein
MTENISGTSPRAARWMRRTVVVGVGLILLATLVVAARQRGDEPPIRVRNGSMIFQLETTNWPSAKWVVDGDNWAPSQGSSKGMLRAVIQTADGYDCPAGTTLQGTSVAVTYDQTTTVTIHGGPQGRTFLTPRNLLTLVPGSNDTQLVHGQGGTGRVTGLTVRGAGPPKSCSVLPSAPQPKLDVLICSWDLTRPCQ